MNLDDIWPGRLCTWVHVPHGGYGYAICVPVKVERRTLTRVLVHAGLASGGTKMVWVRPESLRATTYTDKYQARAARKDG